MVLPHLDDAYGLARWLTGNRTDAEDVVQDACIRALASLETAVVERPRAFVRCDKYFGPDRRRHTLEEYAGPWRRQDDFQQEVDVR